MRRTALEAGWHHFNVKDQGGRQRRQIDAAQEREQRAGNRWCRCGAGQAGAEVLLDGTSEWRGGGFIAGCSSGDSVGEDKWRDDVWCGERWPNRVVVRRCCKYILFKPEPLDRMSKTIN